ncbi:MAG: signal recognition particle-docking protein FtsY, partial [Trichlorobacter sp.]|nr:signal recognition particle-docking protein FtsY [Trichlorobacter sp.]
MSEEKKGFLRGMFERVTGAGTQEPQTPQQSTDDTPKKPGLFERLKSGLKNTTDGLVGRIDALVLG